MRRTSLLYEQLAKQFPILILDAVSQNALPKLDVLLLAQPRLAPQDLVAVDSWVRAGGKTLIFIDPALRWPSHYALGDPRRPPTSLPLEPLLAHWGLRLAAEARPARLLKLSGYLSLLLPGPGVLTREGGTCRLLGAGVVADCRVGKGRAMIVADADLLDERLRPNNVDAARFVADGLDEMAAADPARRVQRQQAQGSYPFRRPFDFTHLALALLPLAALALLAAVTRPRA